MSIYGIIYKITNNINGKAYIGQTTQKMEKRWKQHIYRSNYSDFAFSNAIKKYGPRNFKVESLCEYDNQEDANIMEKYYTDIYWAWINEWGYVCKSGDGKGTLSEDTKKKISEANKGKHSGIHNPMYGKNGNLHHRYKTQHSEETKHEMSIAAIGRFHTQVTKDKIAEVNARPFSIISPAGILITGTNISKFCRDNNLNGGNICQVLLGKMKQHKGWKIVE